ncbi:COX15/CtaA family protein [Arenimonas sp.]|uniref:COX15/CtaA family protein n=1 Tax=Arenimonas sp. TaxID=1872635 RepID=UPI0039E43AF9
MTSPHRHYHRLAWAAVLLAFAIVIFGAFVRLSNAGLSCPDWPTCYGRATWPVHDHEIAQANATFERAVETGKAWREQVHRHLAGGLGLLILLLALIAAQKRRFGVAQIAGAAALVAASIPLYIGKHYEYAAAMALAGEAWLLIQAIRGSNSDASRLSAIVLMVVVFQAVLGMWTVTWLLKPVVVMAHLLGGLATFSLLVWLAWATTPGAALVQAVAPKLRRLLWIGLALLALQIALGGWTSSNYAALACGSDFPKCLGQWWPQHDFREAFVLWRGIGVDYEGGVLDGPARVAIQLSHRIVALLVFGHLLAVAIRMIRTPGLLFWGCVLAVLLCAQIALGIGNVLLSLPLWVAVAHTGGAALLLFVIVGLLARLRAPE